MNDQHTAQVAEALSISLDQVRATADLLSEGATVPFIARYRKEATGSLDEVVVTEIRDQLKRLAELADRREAILKSLSDNEHLTAELEEAVSSAATLSELEDLYLPYRPKRRTRATIAREKGLAPLATMILDQSGIDPESAALGFIDPEKGVENVTEALSGARDILAEMVNEDAQARAEIRELFSSKGMITSKVATGKETEGAKFRDYFDWSESVVAAPSHRVLAMRRGEREEVLNLTIEPPESDALAILGKRFVTLNDGESRSDSEQVRLAVNDGYKRLMSRSMETETRLKIKERADTEAIRVFGENLKELLMSPPLGAKRVMGVDPGFRTGCKVVCLDAQGKLLAHDTIYPHSSEKALEASARTILSLCTQHQMEAVAIGNGTAGRETEAFFRELPSPCPNRIYMVNESGASIYSASEVAREEFPDLDLTVRGAISIARRLIDPLAELVKIDPKSIGVGQYQHDVDQTRLREALDDVVINCVNAVGVDVNRASAQLLTYVSGLGPQLAKNIVAHRDTNGPFKNRSALKKVTRLGPKAFEQCAGFLRIMEGDNPLDQSAVHPERYELVASMAKDLGCPLAELLRDSLLRDKIDIRKYVSDAVGIPTLTDILKELAKPGRDPRPPFEDFKFADVKEITDLVPGMRLPGIVTNVTAFGAFVDVGVHQDGLVHISQIADRFVQNPAEVVKVRQKVQVTVLEVDIERRRISLSMKQHPVMSGDTSPAPKKHPAAVNRSGGKPHKPEKRRDTPAQTPFNNPFADLLKRK
jgi:protein Tex